MKEAEGHGALIKMGEFDKEGWRIMDKIIKYSIKRGATYDEIIPILMVLGELWTPKEAKTR